MNCCSLCEKIFLSEEQFNIYLCYDCHNQTSFCLNCDKIMSKIFNNTNIFKCSFCNKKQTFFALNEEKYKIWENRK